MGRFKVGNRVFWAGVVLVATCILSAGQVVAQTSVRALQKEIKAAYAKVPETYRNNDVKAYGALLAPNVRIKMPDGKTLDHKGAVEFARQDMKVVRDIKEAKLDIHSSKVNGNAVTSDATEVWVYRHHDLNGEFGPKGKVYPMTFRARGIHTHIKTPQGWVLKSMVAKGAPVFISGGKQLTPLAQKK